MYADIVHWLQYINIYIYIYIYMIWTPAGIIMLCIVEDGWPCRGIFGLFARPSRARKPHPIRIPKNHEKSTSSVSGVRFHLHRQWRHTSTWSAGKWYSIQWQSTQRPFEKREKKILTRHKLDKGISSLPSAPRLSNQWMSSNSHEQKNISMAPNCSSSYNISNVQMKINW